MSIIPGTGWYAKFFSIDKETKQETFTYKPILAFRETAYGAIYGVVAGSSGQEYIVPPEGTAGFVGYITEQELEAFRIEEANARFQTNVVEHWGYLQRQRSPNIN